MYLKQCLVTSNVEFFKGNVGDIIKSHKTIKQYAYILHDKDAGQSPHWTIYLNFGSSGVDTKQVGEWFGLQESQVERIKGRKTDALQYLTHSNDTQKYKYQYPTSEIIANFDFETEINNSKILGDFQNFSYAEQLAYVHSLPRSERVSAFRELKHQWEIQCQWLTLNPDRNINVMFVTGIGGTGKTYYAKRVFEEKLRIDYAVSSASNDIMQDYLGQRGLLLDDCRDKTFNSFEDCLKFLDNHTSSSVKSRFNNKTFNGEWIIITSATELYKWFRGTDNKGNPYNLTKADFIQLYRRICCYVEITKKYIYTYNDIDENGKPKGLAKVYKNDLFEKSSEKQEKRDFRSLFDDICEPATTDVFDTEQIRIENNNV